MAADLSYSPNYARIKSEVPGLTDEQYSIMCAKISANSFGTAEYLALYYQCSLFNHNCAPNACQYHEESLEAKIYLIEPVRKGDEICISYRGKISIRIGAVMLCRINIAQVICYRCRPTDAKSGCVQRTDLTAIVRDVPNQICFRTMRC
jgi:hypothetical protein